MFRIGLHPLGARWIQEHYTFVPGQETYSYYGVLNRLAFNIGYHNEHHDLVRIPWVHLPTVKALAPEFYDHLHAHRSLTRVLFQWLFDRDLDLHTRITRARRRPAAFVDQPVAALLYDLRARGLLESTLVVWATEFGRTPFAQGNGRDHNPQGFSIWLAGAGVRGGMTYGATDEYGYHAVEDVVSVHDLHATILHLLGFDHTRLTFRYAGRDFRLTDVHGEVIHQLLV